MEKRSLNRRDRDKELENMAQDAKNIAVEARNAVSTHEKLCAERQSAILQRLGRVEAAVYAAMTGIIGIWAVANFVH